MHDLSLTRFSLHPEPPLPQPETHMWPSFPAVWWRPDCFTGEWGPRGFPAQGAAGGLPTAAETTAAWQVRLLAGKGCRAFRQGLLCVGI